MFAFLLASLHHFVFSFLFSFRLIFFWVCLLLIWWFVAFYDFNRWKFLLTFLILIISWPFDKGIISEIIDRIYFALIFFISLSPWEVKFLSVFQLCSKLLPFTSLSNSFALVAFVSHYFYWKAFKWL